VNHDLAPPQLHFGGPDRPPRALRDLLKARIAAVPAGGDIRWTTYYFRDLDLAAALMEACNRGVRVRLCVEGHPRLAPANGEVLARLNAHGLGNGLRVHVPALSLLTGLHGHLHAKIYAFSHPQPVALIGSFNPSCNIPEDAAVIAEIGDQDRGHNMLAEFTHPALVNGLCDHVDRMWRYGASSLLRFSPRQNRVLTAGPTAIYFYPRLCPSVMERDLSRPVAGKGIRGVISHLKKGPLAQQLASAARRGLSVELVVHDTERRVPEATIDMLADAGVKISRYRHPDNLPVHAKFLLLDVPEGRVAYFGSFNFNPRSRYLNHEVLVRTQENSITAKLDQRFEEIAQEKCR